VEFCAIVAGRCALLFAGDIISQGATRQFFAGHSFYTTAANRMARHLLPKAITVEDIIAACGRHMPEVGVQKIDDSNCWERCSNSAADEYVENGNKEADICKHPRFWLAWAVIVLAIPLTIWCGLQFLSDRRYLIVSLLVLAEAMLPFLLLFERRKPQARELTLLAVLTALAVASRAAFAMLPQFKPMAAFVIISGAALGPETGFLVGALSALISNFLFGQGPWTPWQMFGLGMMGLLAGLLFARHQQRIGRKSLCLYGGLSTFIIYGALMNPAAVLMFQGQPTKEMFMLAYIQGLPFDIVHALATVVFLWALGPPMLEKLQRVKSKYGILKGR